MFSDESGCFPICLGSLRPDDMDGAGVALHGALARIFHVLIASDRKPVAKLAVELAL